MFDALHHLTAQQVHQLLEGAVDQRRAVAMFDVSSPPCPPPPGVLLLGTLPGILLAMLFVQPFRWSRLLWTYIIPVIPLSFTWDALVTGLRLYSVRELRETVAGLPPNDYIWKVGQEPFPHSITYLTGYPPYERPVPAPIEPGGATSNDAALKPRVREPVDA